MTAAIFKFCYVIGLIVGSVIRGVYMRPYRSRSNKTAQKIDLDRLLITLSSLGLLFLPLIYLLTPWLDFADYYLPLWLGWLGAVVFTAALWLLWRSHVDLGQNFSPELEILEGHALVTHGVYKHIRHPMYAAHWLWGIAQALLLQNWIAGLSMLVTLAPLYYVRVPREEQMMLEHFGDEYQTYMERTGRVIPRVLGYVWGESPR